MFLCYLYERFGSTCCGISSVAGSLAGVSVYLEGSAIIHIDKDYVLFLPPSSKY
jgi:hypothetical protein